MNSKFVQIRCRSCQRLTEGIILPAYNLKLCPECFVEFFKKRVKETIEKFGMFQKQDKILVAISGGKDSIALSKALKDLGYQVSLLHINSGIKKEDYSEKSQKIVKEFAKRENLPLKIVYLEKEIGTNLNTCAKLSKKKICAVCGMIRRYLLNREAKAFDVLVTGHTLNDEASSLLSSLIFWKEGFLKRQWPSLKEKETLKKRVKPLCFVSEKETRLFCEILNLPYLQKRCPFRKGTYVFFKKIINEIEKEMPPSILNFYKGFLKRKRGFGFISQKEELFPCKECGYLTIAGICNFCRLKKKVKNYLKERN